MVRSATGLGWGPICPEKGVAVFWPNRFGLMPGPNAFTRWLHPEDCAAGPPLHTSVDLGASCELCRSQIFLFK